MIGLLIAVPQVRAQDWSPPRRDPRFPGTAPANPSTAKTGEQLVKVRALVDSEDLRPGDTFHLVFIFDIEPGWHIYWENAGASGAPTSVQVQGPHEFIIGKTKYPRPSIFSDPDGKTYGYHDQAAIFVEVTVPQNALAGKAHFSASLNWLVCKDVCLMGRSKQLVEVQINPRSMPGTPPREKPTPSSDPVVQQFKKRLPSALDSLENAESHFSDSVLTIRLPVNGQSTAMFYPGGSPGVTYGEATVKKDGDALKIAVPVTLNPNNSLGEPMRIAGVVGYGGAESLDEPCYSLEIPLPES